MKGRKILFWILMLAPMAVTLFALPFLPEQIPAHYGFGGQVDRWGSKYETLIFSAITIVFGLFMLALARYSAKQKNGGKQNEKVSLTTGLCCLALFNVMTGYFLYADFHKVENLSEVDLHIYQIVCAVLGIGFIVMGKIMPKLSLNSVIGLRTVWSMKNETTWKKSQEFGGITFILTGIFMIICSLTVPGSGCILWTLLLLAAMLLADVWYTYHAAKKYGKDGSTPSPR